MKHSPDAGQIPVITSILKDFSAEALGELRTWLEQNPPAVTISSIIGFEQFTVQVGTYVATQETTTSTTFTNLATVGPSLPELPNGQYIFAFGAIAFTDTALGFAARMSIDINGAGASTSDACATTIASPGLTSISRITTATLSAGNNTVTAKYLSDNNAHTMTFGNRWLIALKYANA